ncbi:molecular chaperone HtpG [bacterium]|nr:molecular chaperone HtpG [bacterium]
MPDKAKPKTKKFKAEVKQVLDIVINSLYTNKEIFVRELISNASDALEKVRHRSLTEKEIFDKDLPLEIRIETDEKAKTFSISDTGVGLTAAEAEENLGTIAHSGSREFLQKLEDGEATDADLIGQFGVGFYASFMVAKEVFVTSRSYKSEAEGIRWTSKGAGNYSITDQPGLHRGTKIVLDMQEDQEEYANSDRIKELIKQYSNFVPFPIFVDGEQVNTVQAIWTKSKSDVSEGEYKEFYKFIANAMDEPTFTFHFNADVPLEIRSILYVPDSNMEKFHFGRMEPGVHLYCRKVLIQQQAEKLLPEYLRFLRGVVDSSDLPLNISRETMQDSALVARLNRVITGRFLKFLDEQAHDDEEKYSTFFKEFGMFIKEGATSDFERRDELAKLLRFASSAIDDDKYTSLDAYIERMKEKQESIYYLSGPSRDAIEAGPYLEAFREQGIEVLYLYESIDDFVLNSLREYKEKKLVSADQADLKLPEKEETEEKEEETDTSLPENESGDLARWMKEILGDSVEEVRTSKRLVKSPALLVNPDEFFTTGMQRIMQATSNDNKQTGRYILEINPKHKILKQLNDLRISKSQEDLAKVAVESLYGNAMISAGMMIDPKVLVERNTQMLERALGSNKSE